MASTSAFLADVYADDLISPTEVMQVQHTKLIGEMHVDTGAPPCFAGEAAQRRIKNQVSVPGHSLQAPSSSRVTNASRVPGDAIQG